MDAKPKILVVDDDPVNVKLARFVLQADGFEVATATSAEEARGILKSFAPAMILMDVQMPITDGLTFTKELKAAPESQAIPIFAVSASTMAGDEEKCRAAGCDGFLAKPINTRELGRVIRNHLGLEQH